MKIAADISHGLEYIHKANIVHRALVSIKIGKE